MFGRGHPQQFLHGWLKMKIFQLWGKNNEFKNYSLKSAWNFLEIINQNSASKNFTIKLLGFLKKRVWESTHAYIFFSRKLYMYYLLLYKFSCLGWTCILNLTKFLSAFAPLNFYWGIYYLPNKHDRALFWRLSFTSLQWDAKDSHCFINFWKAGGTYQSKKQTC